MLTNKEITRFVKVKSIVDAKVNKALRTIENNSFINSQIEKAKEEQLRLQECKETRFFDVDEVRNCETELEKIEQKLGLLREYRISDKKINESYACLAKAKNFYNKHRKILAEPAVIDALAKKTPNRFPGQQIEICFTELLLGANRQR